MKCPSCEQHHWSDKVRGRRACPQCGAVVALRKAGAELVTIHRFRRATGRKAPSNVERFYRVIRPDDCTILCACCASPTTMLHGIDGRIETDGTQKMNVQQGWIHVDGSHELTPRWIERAIPRIIRGVICADCQSRFSGQFRPVRQAGLEDRRPLNIKSANFNTRAQRLEAEAGELFRQMAAANGADDPTLATSLLGANWAHTGDPSWIDPSLASKAKYPTGFNTGYWFRDYALSAHTVNGAMVGYRFRHAKVLAKKASNRLVEIPSPEELLDDILADTVARKLSGSLVGMDALTRGMVVTLRGLLRPKRYRLTVGQSRPATTQATGLHFAKMPAPPARRHALSWHFPGRENPNPYPSIREYRDEAKPVLAEAERCRPITGRFCSRPLPKRAIPLRPV